MYKITKETKLNNSFKNQSIIGQYDLQDKDKIVEEFKYDFEIPKEFRLGVIVGNSGTGKTTLAGELFHFEQNQYDNTVSVVDSISAKLEDISKMFTLVGFASPRSWLKPYSVLSNGEKMRVDLARELLSDREQICFDEFTSVVDRNVAKTMCHVINKVIRTSRKKIVLVSCHFDILDYLDTDWIINTNDNTLFLGKKKDWTGNAPYTMVNQVNGSCLASITI
jgi:ABC-type transport system involved in cytochrome bd biosynthesis fused ATPase/permease subunit